MTRAAAFVLVLVGLALSGVKLVHAGFEPGHGGRIDLASGEQLARVELASASAVEAESRAFVGTYADVDLRRYQDLRVVYANDARFCLEVVKDGRTYHEAGPGGEPEFGPCLSPR